MSDGGSTPLTPRSARVAAAVKLQRHTGRRRTGRFLAEGPNLVEAAAGRGLVEEVFVTATAMQRYAALLDGLPVRAVTDAAAAALSDTVTPTGLVAVCRTPQADLDDVLAGHPTLVVVAVEVSEPGNAGTMIRTSAAMGAAAVVLAGHSVDPYNGKCLRSSAGAIFALPVLAEPDTDGLLERLRAAGLVILATTVDGELSLDDAAPLLAAPTAWVFGAESRGLDTSTAAAADHRVFIPMANGTESLNVGAAAAVCLYQSALALRNRRTPLG